MDVINTGVIGLGMGRGHARGFDACPDARVAVLCDSDEQRLAEESEKYPDALTCSDYRQMLEMEDLDAVAVALPNYLHAPVTLDLLRAGKHVLCEKPMAMNAGEAETMKAEAEARNRILMLHFNMRFMSTAATLRPLVDAGEFGKIYHITTTYTRRNGYPHPGSWFGQRARSGGGPLIDLGVHRLDLALWLMDYPPPASVLGCNYDLLAKEKMADFDFDCEDFSAALIRFADGSSMYLASSWDGHQAQDSEITMNIYGARASAFERDGELTLCADDAGEPSVRRLGAEEPQETPQQHFIRTIRNGAEPGPSAAHGVTVMRLLDAIYESARTGKEVRL